MQETLDRIFKLKERGTTVSTEVYAGITTFMTMAYILAVNPAILGDAGMDRNVVFTATALSAFIATMCMAFMANLPFALAAGMGLNAFFAYTVAPQFGWQLALCAVFIEGILFILLSLFNVREAIFNAIPQTLKYAVSVGIGLFICLVGLTGSGIIVGSPATTVTLGNVKSVSAVLTFAGILIIAILMVNKVKGALLWGILLTWVLGMLCQAGGLYVPNPAAGMYSLYPTGPDGNFALVSLQPSLADYNLISAIASGQFSGVSIFDFAVVVTAFLFVDLFDTVGTLIGVSEKAGMLDAKGRLPRLKQALLSDAIGTTAGAMLGTSTVTTYVESASGVSVGGRTGLTALVTGLLFLGSLVFAPLFAAIPAFATAPALIFVGLFMVEAIVKIDFTDYSEGLPAFLCIVMMPFAYSISEGLIFGVLGYVLIKALTGQAKAVSAVMYVVAFLFMLKLVLG